MGSGRDYILEQQIGHILRLAHQRASAIFKSQFAAHDLTPTQFTARMRIVEFLEAIPGRDQ